MTQELRVLLVEDSESDALLVARMLRGTGRPLRTRRVETEAQLRAALAEESWDVVISDYQLPGFSAPAALAIVQASGLDLPFIVVSGTMGEDNAVAMMKAGAQDYLMKAHLARLAPAVLRELQDARHRQARRDAETTQVALQARLLETQREAYMQLLQWHRRLEQTKDEERRLLSRELHDEMGQTLTMLKLRLALLGRAEPSAVAAQTSEAVTLVDDLIDRVRKIAVDLRPPLLDDLGLGPALRALLESCAQRSDTTLHIDLDDLEQRLAPELELACFRIVQEAVTNVLRHAHASQVWVRVARAGQQLSITVQDDGCGVSDAQARASIDAGHLGLVGMRERTRALGGEFTLSSPPASGESRGTCIEVSLPALARAPN